jgi:hypothetical protein
METGSGFRRAGPGFRSGIGPGGIRQVTGWRSQVRMEAAPAVWCPGDVAPAVAGGGGAAPAELEQGPLDGGALLAGGGVTGERGSAFAAAPDRRNTPPVTRR